MNFKKMTKRSLIGASFFAQKGQTNMTKTTLYHGSTQQFTAFDLNHLGQNGTAQGAGIYTTPDQDVAAMYAQLTDEPGYIYQVASDLKKPLSLERVTVSDQELSKIIDQLHEETDLLSNYGDVDYSGYSPVKAEALELLRENDNDVDLFNDLASASGDPQITAEAFEAAGDYTHIVSHDQTRLNSDVYTILNPKNVEITNIESTNEYTQEIQNQIENSTSLLYPLYSPDALDQYVEDTAQHYTSDIREAMHLFPDGRMVSSTEEGIRGDDHSVISNYCDNIGYPGLAKFDRQSMMSILAEGAGVVIIVPETKKALKTSNQKLTPQQAEVLNHSEFELKDFSSGVTEEPQSLEAAGISKELSRKLSLVNNEEVTQLPFERLNLSKYEKEIPEEINNWLQQDLVPTHGKGNDKFYISQEEGQLIISDVLSMDGDVSYDLNRKGIELAEIEQEISRHFKNYKSIDKFYDDAEISTKNMTIDARATIYNGDFHQEVETLVQKNYQNTTTKTNELEPGVYHETLQFDAEGRQRQLTMLYGEQNKVELGMDQLSENGATTLKIDGDQQGGQIIKDLLDSPQLADKEVTYTPNAAEHSEIDYHSPNRTKRAVDQSIGIE